MASIKGEKSASKIVTLLVLVFAGVIFYATSHLFLPKYRYLEVDFEELAAEYKIPVTELDAKRDYVVRFAPRHRNVVKDDPYPWQILHKDPKKTPSWVKDADGDVVDEWQVMIRCQLISDRTGDEPSALEMNVGSTFQDRYFKISAWRLPAGSIGVAPGQGRHVFMFEASSVEKLSINDSHKWKSALKKGGDDGWITDDDWPARYDGVGPHPDG